MKPPLEIMHLTSGSRPGEERTTPDADPADIRNLELVFRPRSRWFLGVGFGVMLWLALMIVFGFAIQRLPNPPGLTIRVLSLAALFAVHVAPVFLAIRLGRGGTCILNGDGARFIRGGTEVFCPWPLFSAPGQPVVHFIKSDAGTNATDLFELPVESAAVSLVEARRKGIVVARGLEVKTPQFRFRSAQEAFFTNYYLVNTAELAGLLLAQGRLLGNPTKERAAAAIASPHTAKNGGWMTITLTRLAFPSVCCDCGAPTIDTQSYRVHHMTGFAWIPIPVCESCQRAFRQNHRRAFWKPVAMMLAIAAAGGFLVGSLPALLGRDPKSFPILSILCAIAAGVICLPVAWFLANKWATGTFPPPVELRRYLVEGSVSLRFRRPEYAEQVRAYVEGRSQPR